MNHIIQHAQFGEIRVQTIKNQPWFCAKDICDVLEHSDPSKAVVKLEEDEKLMRTIFVSGQNREMLFVNESGLYALIIRSNKPEARKFRKWVTSEVLPSIRQYGTYSTDEWVMNKAKKRAAAKAVKLLHKEVEDNLSGTDIRLIAKQCLTDEWEVAKVLDGEKEDVYMMSLLYARATGNTQLRKLFYTQEGAEKLVAELQKKRITN